MGGGGGGGGSYNLSISDVWFCIRWSTGCMHENYALIKFTHDVMVNASGMCNMSPAVRVVACVFVFNDTLPISLPIS